MTKQHFVALADSIRKHNHGRAFGGPEFSAQQIECLSAFCAQQNPSFNRARWLAYVAGNCGPNGGKRKV